MTDIRPFQGRRLLEVPQEIRVLARFTKPGDKVAELRERKVTQFAALEWMLVIDGNLIETRLYHGARLPAYPNELQECHEHLINDGWTEATLMAEAH